MSEGKTMEIPDKKESIEQPANNVYFIQKNIVYRKTDSLEAYCLHIFLATLSKWVQEDFSL